MNADSALRELVERQKWFEDQIASAESEWIDFWQERFEDGDDVPDKEHFVSLWLAERCAELLAAPQAAPAGMVLVPRESLKIWRELVDLNPADIAPRIDRMLAAAPTAQVAECICDGATYRPDQGRPFLINRACPKHGEMKAAAPAAPVAEVIDPESLNFKEGLAVGMSCERALANKVLNPVCGHCGARNNKEAADKCVSEDNACPGMEFPLCELWQLSEAAAPEAPGLQDNRKRRPQDLINEIHKPIYDSIYYSAMAGDGKIEAPAVVVDEAMVERACREYAGYDGDARNSMRAALAAALNQGKANG